MPKIKTIALCGYLFICACAKNDPQRPPVAIPNDWDVKDSYSLSLNQKKLSRLKWWTVFHDPALEHFIHRGLQCNTKILISKSRIDAAIGELKRVRNQWIPNADFWTGYANNPIYGFPGTLFVFVPSYFINIYQQYHEHKIARIKLEQTRAEDDTIKVMIISEIANSYFGYLSYKNYQNLLAILYHDLKRMENISIQMHQIGLIADIEPHAIQHQRMRIEGEKHLTHRNIIRTRNALRYLINQNPGKICTTHKFEQLMVKPSVIHAVPMRVLLNRPDMKMAECRLKAAYYNVNLAQSPFLPRFEFDIFPGWVAGNNAYSIPNKYLHFNDQLLKIHVFQWSVLGEIEKAKGQKKAVFYSFLDTLRQAMRDTSNAYINHDRTTKNLSSIEAATHELWRVYQRNQQLQKQGIHSEFDMLKAKIEYDRMRLVLNRAQLQQILSIVRLYQELAGGYEEV